jgi:hypothetical protein
MDDELVGEWLRLADNDLDVAQILNGHHHSMPRHCERSEAIQAQAVQPGRLSGGRLCLDCFVPRNDGVGRRFSTGYAALSVI